MVRARPRERVPVPELYRMSSPSRLSLCLCRALHENMCAVITEFRFRVKSETNTSVTRPDGSHTLRVSRLRTPLRDATLCARTTEPPTYRAHTDTRVAVPQARGHSCTVGIPTSQVSLLTDPRLTRAAPTCDADMGAEHIIQDFRPLSHLSSRASRRPGKCLRTTR